MARIKRTLTKGDVQFAMADYFRHNYLNLKIIGTKKPQVITRVLATIQDFEFTGIGKYNVLFDIYGNSKDIYDNIIENEHYTTRCVVEVSVNPEGEPIPTINEQILLTKERN